MKNSASSRRRFLAQFVGLGMGSTLLPGVLWAKMDEQGATAITPALLRDAAAVAGLSFTDEELSGILQAVNQNLGRYAALRRIEIPNGVSPPFAFNPLVPGMAVDRTAVPLKWSHPPALARPGNLEDVAFWPVTQLAELIRTRAVTSAELTEMYLARLRRLNAKLNCVVTFLDDVAREQAKRADEEIAGGHYRGPLHGIPWGAKDIIAFKGYKTTWGSGAFQDQRIDEDASVIEILRDAGAVLLAKLATGELAGGDQWFGGRTNNPWKLDQGSSGSSAGPASATAAGCVGFAIGSETSGSILSPTARCGCTGLRPTFGRVSRHGVMTLSWTQDRLGPFCRAVEDCALVLSVIARPDGRDLSVSDIPFNWDASAGLGAIRVGYLKEAFEDSRERDPAWVANDRRAIETLRGLGITLVPISVPDRFGEVTSISVEAAVSFDAFLRSGRTRYLTLKNRAVQFRSARFVPAVEYLQSQRVRSMMMQDLAEATAGVDVYLAPSTNASARPETEGAAAAAASATPRQPQNLAQQHFRMANLACYPGLGLPHGFAANGAPTSITFMGRPFGEAKVLAVAKAYQDATDFHLKHPVL